MAEGKTVEITDANFEQEVLNSDIPVLVDFWAPWCGPCKMAGPVLEETAQQHEGKLKVCKLNVDESRQTALRYNVMSIPTLNLFKNGDVVEQIVGVPPGYQEEINKKVQPHLENG